MSIRGGGGDEAHKMLKSDHRSHKFGNNADTEQMLVQIQESFENKSFCYTLAVN